MMTEEAHKMIKTVDIYHNGVCIEGFSFFDRDRLPIFEVGATKLYSSWTVVLADNEVIIGVACKLYEGEQSRYTDF